MPWRPAGCRLYPRTRSRRHPLTCLRGRRWSRGVHFDSTFWVNSYDIAKQECRVERRIARKTAWSTPLKHTVRMLSYFGAGPFPSNLASGATIWSTYSRCGTNARLKSHWFSLLARTWQAPIPIRARRIWGESIHTRMPELARSNQQPRRNLPKRWGQRR